VPHYFLCKSQCHIRTLPKYITSVTHQWQWPVKVALEATVASEVGIPGLSHAAISRSCMGSGPGT
jgi:hypothetical protein